MATSVKKTVVKEETIASLEAKKAKLKDLNSDEARKLRAKIRTLRKKEEGGKVKKNEVKELPKAKPAPKKSSVKKQEQDDDDNEA